MENKEVLFAEERQSRILKLLKKEHKVLVPQLCELYGVSPATIRNDLNDMESRGLLKRTHGGAILNTKMGFEQNVEQKLTRNSREKEAIAKIAAEYVEDGDAIAIDTGTTTLAFARCLTEKKNLTVITNDLNIAAFLDAETDATVILLGGMLRKKHHCTLGSMTLSCIQGLRVDKCFMATNGLTAQHGLSTPDLNHAEVKRCLATCGAQIIVLCDSEKIGQDVFVNVLPAEQADILITDSGADQAELERFEQLGVEVRTAQI